MTDNSLPRWSVRLDAFRPHGFSDLVPIVSAHYRLHEAAEKFLGPYNARQRASTFPYRAPEKETLRQMIQQGRVNDITYNAFLNSLIRFCEITKGSRGLPAPHPSTIHSIQLPRPAFEFEAVGAGVTMITIPGVLEPLEVKGLRQPDDVKFIIVRPKLSRLGTASGTNWEVLFFREPLGYIPNWADSDLNPRFSGRW